MILGTNRSVRVWAYARPADLRKGYNGLYGLVKNELGRDPLGGELYLFVNRRRDSCKILAWDGTGLCIFMKRLERGRFAPLWSDESTAVKLTPAELRCLALVLHERPLRLARPAAAPHTPAPSAITHAAGAVDVSGGVAQEQPGVGALHCSVPADGAAVSGAVPSSDRTSTGGNSIAASSRPSASTRGSSGSQRRL